MKKLWPVAIALCVSLLGACTGVDASFLERAASTTSITSIENTSSSVSSASVASSPSSSSSAYSRVVDEEPFYYGAFEYIVAEPPDGDWSSLRWSPIIYILLFNEDGSVLFFRHYHHSEFLALYEGQYVCEEERFGYTVTLDLTCTYAEEIPNISPEVGDTKHTVLSMMLDGPPLNRVRITLLSGDKLFEAQREEWPNWFTKETFGSLGQY